VDYLPQSYGAYYGLHTLGTLLELVISVLECPRTVHMPLKIAGTHRNWSELLATVDLVGIHGGGVRRRVGGPSESGILVESDPIIGMKMRVGIVT
jgi:hypothetical protein